jgi:hypothetical protein
MMVLIIIYIVLNIIDIIVFTSFHRYYLILNFCSLPLRHVLKGEDNRSTRLTAGAANQLIFDGAAPAAVCLRFLILRPGDGLGVQIFLRIRDHEFQRFGFALGLDRPGLGDLKVFQMSFTSLSRVRPCSCSPPSG